MYVYICVIYSNNLTSFLISDPKVSLHHLCVFIGNQYGVNDIQ